MIILDTGSIPTPLSEKLIGSPDCWRIVDYFDTTGIRGAKYAFEFINSKEMRIVGKILRYNELSPIHHFCLVNGLKGVRNTF